MHLIVIIALGVLAIVPVIQLCALALLIVCAPFAILLNELKLWSK